MNLKYVNPGFDYMLKSILAFQEDAQSDYFRSALFHFYPQIDRDSFENLQVDERIINLKNEIEQIFKENNDLMNQKIIDYQNYWNENQSIIQSSLEEEFEMDLTEELNDMKANISLNPICPRYLSSTTFDIFYLNSHKGALGLALHEIVHFIWFKVWNRHFKDDVNEYEYPHLKWIFSEIVVDPILGNKELRKLNPYYDGGCVYDYFYQMKVNDQLLIETIRYMYKNNNIKDFMIKGNQYFLENEKEIRLQIK